MKVAWLWGRRGLVPAGLCLAITIVLGVWAWHALGRGNRNAAAIRGRWGWTDASLFEFQKIDFRFSADSFFLAQRFFDPVKPGLFMPCSQADHEIHAAGRYFLSGDTLTFKGDFTDPVFSRDTLRLCRDFGFRGASHFTLLRDSLCLRPPGSSKGVCLVRMKTKH